MTKEADNLKKIAELSDARTTSDTARLRAYRRNPAANAEIMPPPEIAGRNAAVSARAASPSRSRAERCGAQAANKHPNDPGASSADFANCLNRDDVCTPEHVVELTPEQKAALRAALNPNQLEYQIVRYAVFGGICGGLTVMGFLYGKRIARAEQRNRDQKVEIVRSPVQLDAPPSAQSQPSITKTATDFGSPASQSSEMVGDRPPYMS